MNIYIGLLLPVLFHSKLTDVLAHLYIGLHLGLCAQNRCKPARASCPLKISRCGPHRNRFNKDPSHFIAWA